MSEVARWKHISDNEKNTEIEKVIDEAMVAIGKENIILKGVLPKNYSRTDFDNSRLVEIVDEFTNLPTVDETKTYYEECMNNA